MVRWLFHGAIMLSAVLVGDVRAKNRAPVVQVSGTLEHGSPRRGYAPNDAFEQTSTDITVSPDHVFYSNYLKEFSWTEPELQQRLWEGRTLPKLEAEIHELRKRSPPKKIGPLVTTPGCLGCLLAELPGGEADISQLTVNYMMGMMKEARASLYDRCVFYTSITPQGHNDPGEDWLKAKKLRTFGPLSKTPDRLSKQAAQWACDNGLLSIWALWTGKSDETPRVAREDPQSYNFYEAYVKGSWLYKGLVDTSRPPASGEQPKLQKYFENMSEAMARMCSGRIWVMSLDPTHISKYGRIWGEVELPALRSRRNMGGRDVPQSLVAVDAVNASLKYLLDWDTLEATPLKEKFIRAQPNETVAKLHARDDLCVINCDYEPDGDDWFG